MDERIPQEVLDAAHRKLCRHVAATVAQAMSESGVGFKEAAARLGCQEKVLRNWFMRMMDGTAKDFRDVSDLCCAMDCEMNISLRKISYTPAAEQP